MVGPPLPMEMSKEAGAVKRVLFGNKSLSPKALEEVRKSVTPSGWIPVDPDRGFIKSLLLGHAKNPLQAIKSRFQQGGVLGKGGLIRGELAVNPELFERINRIKGGTARWTDYPMVPGHLLGTAANAGFMVGLPAVGVHSAMTAPLLPGETRLGNALREVGSTGGWYLAGPLGLPAELLAGAAFGTAGESIGKALMPNPPVRRAVRRTSSLPAASRNEQNARINPADHLQLTRNGYMIPPTGVEHITPYPQ